LRAKCHNGFDYGKGAMSVQQKSNTYTLLHLTDLHFGSEARAYQQLRMSDQRDIALDALVERLQEVVNEASETNGPEGHPGWTPDAVAISGDLAYSGKATEYRKVGEFLARLKSCLRPTGNSEPLDFIACSGNHDRNSGPAGGLTYPKDDLEADEWLAPDQFASSEVVDSTVAVIPLSMRMDAPNLLRPFSEFVRFCQPSSSGYSFLKPEGITGLEWLTGIARSSHESRIQFLVLNSAWFCNYRNADFGKLWVGLPLLERLHRLGELSLQSSDDDIPLVRVALVHHAREWFHQAEINSYSDRPNTYRYLSSRVDVVLSGHVHGTLESPSRAYDEALVFTGGATYDTGRYRNNFSLLQIDFDDRTVRRRGFEYDPRDQRWKEDLTVQGVFALRRLQVHKRADRQITAADLVGNWKAVYWHELSRRSKKFEHVVAIVLDPSDSQQVTGIGQSQDGSVGYQFAGKLANGFLTGTWQSEERPQVKNSETVDSKSRNGVFQFRIEKRGNQMTGRWLGFDRHDSINHGQWKLWKK
jgi:3',5'-cyclic AMP phosphodiesterase CpdA